MKAITAIVLDTRKPLKNGKFPVKLRVTFNRKQAYYPADLSLSQAEFHQIMDKKAKGMNKTIKLQLDAIEQKANQIISEMSVFDFSYFKKLLYSNQNVREDVYKHYESKIKQLKIDGSHGTASSYQTSLNSLKAFKKNLIFLDVTVDFLRSYERHMLNEGSSPTTVGIYLRTLRAIINQAIEEGTLSKDYKYPFGGKAKTKFQIPTSRNIKKALSLNELKLLFEYAPEIGSWEHKALDFWKFSYLANGMNMKDIAYLKYKDIDNEFIRFVRAKTKKTNQAAKPITFFMTNDIKNIISTWANPKLSTETFIFPILNPDHSAEKQRAVIQQFTKMVNKYMKKIAGKLQIDKEITSYYARHSFATVLKRSGKSTSLIKDALGHASEKTTESYLDTLPDESIKDMASLLTKF
jgi:integrase